MRVGLKLFCASICLVALFFSTSKSQSVLYKTRDVYVGLNVPWEIRWGFDDWIWFTERAGRFSRVNPETGDLKKLLFEPEVHSYYELGMLGFDFHPQFPDSPYVYVVYTYADSLSQLDTTLYYEKLVRYTYSPDTLTDRITLFDSIKASDSHNGSRVAVGPDQKLYVTTGETYYTPELAQQDKSPNGKILRFNLDGSIPDDNPWKGSPVWTKGHRNPQGLCFGPDSTLYSSEHMTWHDDEINIIQRGRNYGWPIIEGPTDDPTEFTMKADSNCVDPITTWTPTIAPTGIEYYNNNKFLAWKNSLLLTSLINQGFWQLQLDSSRRNIIGKERYDLLVQYEDTLIPAGRLRDICVSPDGRIFVSTSNVWTPENLYDRIFEILPEILNRTADDSKQNFSVQVYPNPSSDYITISDIPSQSSTIELIDQLGRTVYSSVASSNEVIISVRNITSGAYYVRVASGGAVQTIPVIIK